MPLHWTIHSQQRFFEIICDGLVEAGEVNQMLDALAGSGALGYRKLFDASRGETSMGPLEILQFGARIRALHACRPAPGPLAVVIPEDKYPLLARVLGILSVPKRPLRMFSDPRKARAWLASLPLGAVIQSGGI